jgi:hypothetical protein
MNSKTREFILFFLTPGKIKIYLIILIILAIYSLYYRYSLSKSETVESFHNKNLKANPYKQNEADKDEDSLIEPDISASQYAGETINNNTDDITERTTNITKLKKKVIDNFINTNDTTQINKQNAKQTDNTRYKEEIAKTYKELAAAEDSKLQAYNRAFNEYLEAQRLNKLNVNIADIGNSIEGGIIDIFQSIHTKANANSNANSNKPKKKIVTSSKVNDAVSSEDIIESFVVSEEEGISSKQIKTGTESENILLYILEVVSNFITNFDSSKITYYLQNYKDIVNILTREENLIPAGVLMLVIAFSLFFIDITS